LWTKEVTTANDKGDDDKRRTAILEQYKLCVEMADRISARRALANTFFVTINAAVLTLIGTGLGRNIEVRPTVLLFPLLILLAMCLFWFWVIRSYRQLNAAKYVVIGALEEKLPASPFWLAEWKALDMGENRHVYWPLTHVEKWIPLVFAVAYVGAFFTAVFA